MEEWLQRRRGKVGLIVRAGDFILRVTKSHAKRKGKGHSPCAGEEGEGTLTFPILKQSY